MAGQGPFSYKPNVNRAVTKKWRDANQANYDGDDWGDDDYEEPVPRSADNIRHPGWEGQGQIYPGNRSLTNPSPTRSGGGSSFDQGDERRYYANAGGFDSAYPTTQRSPFPEPQHDYEPPIVGYRNQPPLQVHTAGQGPYPPSGFRPGSRGQQHPNTAEGPFSAPGGFPHRRNQPSDLSSRGDMMQRHESPIRPDSRDSNASGRHFPPRKSSLSQTQPPSDIPSQISDVSSVPPSAASAPNEVKALPFIRPADIYKRIEEEREKERRSQESSRRSLDSANSRTRDHSTGPLATAPEAGDIPEIKSDNLDETESARRVKPTLDTVVERKSEYGFENLLKRADQNQQSLSPEYNVPGGVSRHDTTASSVYSDRPDPVSASSISRNQSMRESGLENEIQESPQSKRYNLPQINRISSFGRGVSDFSFDSYSAEHSPPQPAQESKGATESGKATGSGTDLSQVEQRTSPGPQEGLHHQPSLGYKSAVAQAFDNTQLLSPTSTSDTIPRSNSASTSDISPIVDRKRENIPDQSLVGQTIPEEPANTPKPASSLTSNANGTARPEQPLPPAPSTHHYSTERGIHVPSSENSPAKKALNVQTTNNPHPAQAVLASVGDKKTSAELNSAGSETKSREVSTPATMGGPSTSNTTSNVAPPDERTTSEEWREWQSQRRQFNAQVGLQGSSFTTPDVPSPISRTETPARGTVKDLAGKLEDQSGRSSPLHGGDMEQDSNPLRPPQTRFDSFRPAIPGGWQSYSATPAATSPGQEENKQLQPLNQPRATRFDSTDSIPTAKPAKVGRDHAEGPLYGAFAAAAAAGTALAGAFSGPALSRGMTTDSQDTSENEWDVSSNSSRSHPVTSDTRDFAMLENSPLAGGRGAYTGPVHGESDQHMMAHQPVIGEKSENSNSLSETAETPRAQRFGGQYTHTSPIHAHPHVENLEPLPARPRKDDIEAISNDHALANKPTDVAKLISEEEPTVLRESDDIAQPSAEESTRDVTLASSSATDVPAPLRTSKVFGPATVIRPSVPNVSGPGESPLDDDNERLQQDIVNSLSPPMSYVVGNAPEREANTSSEKFKVDHPINAVESEHRTIQPEGNTQISETPEQSQPAVLPKGPTLERRFSWQMDNDEPSASLPAGEIGSIKGKSPVDTSTSVASAHDEGSTALTRSSTAEDTVKDRSPQPEVGTQVPPPISKDGRVNSKSNTSAQSSKDHPSIRSILNLDTVHQRIKAFDDSRASYAKSDGLLEEWLSSMRIPEHAEVFEGSSHSMPSRTDSASNFRPSPRREIGGSKLQEDRKRLMGAAGRFGGKAGIAAKGLFAKGKDKLRTASAGDKGNRRKSTGPVLPNTDDPQHEPQNGPVHKSEHEPRDSTPPSNPPQIPPQDLNLSPVNAGDWSFPSNITGKPDNSTSAIVAPPTAVEPIVHEGREAKPVFPDFGEDRVEHNDSFNHPEDRDSGALPNNASAEPEREDGKVHGSEISQLAADPSGTSAIDVPPQDLPGDEHKAIESVQVPSEGDKGQVPQTEPTSLDPGLAIPDEQRSVVSKVSSVSPNIEPANDHNHAHRSISPAEDNESHSETIPPYDAISNLKEVEVPEEKSQDETLPSYENEDVKRGFVDQKGIGPESEIIPVADLSAQKRQQRATAQNRPFSFNGAEHLHWSGHHRSAAEELQQPVQSQPSGPVGQPLSKELTVKDNNEDDQNRPQVKSYSRPFVGNINPQDSSSAQQEQNNGTPRYPTNSPLPSARRAPEEMMRQRNAVPPMTQPEEEGYRIPGPYGQEYRSPKQTTNPRVDWEVGDDNQNRDSNAIKEDEDKPVHTQDPQYQQHLEVSASEEQWRPQDAVETPAAIAPLKSRQRSFGGLFKPRWNRSQQNLSEAALNDPEADKQKRGSIFRRNSRNDSLTSQSSNFLEKRDQVGQLPQPDTTSRTRKRLSKEVLRSGTPTSIDRPDGKKKRFSGVSSLFSKRASKDGKDKIPERSSTVPQGANQSNKMNTRNHGHEGPTFNEQHRHLGQSHPNGQFQGIPPPAGGYYGPNRSLSQQDEHHNSSNGQYPGNDLQKYDQGFNQQQAERVDDAYSYSSPAAQNFDRRPTDLRIDTGRNSPKIYGTAHTGPPQTHASRDISYEYRPTASQMAIPTSAGPQRQSRQDSSTHVVDLHKRSRSPKLGRQSSSEDLGWQARNEQLGTQNPADHLGTFTSKRVSPLRGNARPEEDQEAPYRIGIPGEQGEERRRKTRQALIEHGSQSRNTVNGGSTNENTGRQSTEETKTVAQRIIGPQVPDAHQKSLSTKSPLQATHANTSTNATGSKGAFVAELPGSKAEGYESEEEIPMSATFYPGQEWQPIYVGDDRWDD